MTQLDACSIDLMTISAELLWSKGDRRMSSVYENNTAADEYKLPCFLLRLLKMNEH